MHIHTKERPFSCPYKGCSRSFCEREGLIRHESSHENKDVHRCRYELCNEAFQESFQLHRHYREEHDKTTTPVEEVRPIRLQLTQPKRQHPKSSEGISRKRILLRLPMKKTLGGSSTPDPTEGSKVYSESNNFAKRSIEDTGKEKVHEDAHTSVSSLSASSTSEASGNVQVSSHGSIYQPPAIPHTPKLNSCPQASVLQPAANSTSVEPNSHTSCTNGGLLGMAPLRTRAYAASIQVRRPHQTRIHLELVAITAQDAIHILPDRAVLGDILLDASEDMAILTA